MEINSGIINIKLMLNDAKWEIKRGNFKTAYIETENNVLLLGMYNENIVVRYYVYDVIKNSYSDMIHDESSESENSNTTLSIKKRHIKMTPLNIKNGRIRINNDVFSLSERQYIYPYYSIEEAKEEITTMKEMMKLDFLNQERKKDTEQIIKNLNEYISFVRVEEELTKNMKVYQGVN